MVLFSLRSVLKLWLLVRQALLLIFLKLSVPVSVYNRMEHCHKNNLSSCISTWQARSNVSLPRMNSRCWIIFFVCVEVKRPSQQFYSHVWTEGAG